MAVDGGWLRCGLKTTEIVRSRFDGCERVQARVDGGQRRSTVSGGGDLAGVPRFRARGLDFKRGLHRGEAREAANLFRAALPAETRRRRRTTQRGGGATPASYPRRLGARGHQQAAQVASSPPCTTPGQLLDGGEAATAVDCYGDGARIPARCGASEGGS
jgi:hypothetical protein